MLARRVARADPGAAGRTKDRAVARREVRWWRDGDGTAGLTVRGVPTQRVEQAFGRVSAIAGGLKNAGDGRTVDQIERVREIV
jgi:hypothetical protein